MNLHEYQAKHIFKEYGLPVPNNVIAYCVEDALKAMSVLKTKKIVVKAQVHAGGRGKAGGVKIVDNRDALEEAVRSMLHTRLVTYQTDSNGQPVNAVLVEELTNIDKELYLSAVLDRGTKRVILMASTEGGMDIEKVADETPEIII
jgi:succinyl-CoA synthetase beta subunit